MRKTVKRTENKKSKNTLLMLLTRVTLLAIFPIVGIILMFFQKYLIGSVLFVVGVVLEIYLIYEKNKEEERLLFSSLFTLAIFTSTLLSISNKMWGIFAFLLLIVVLLWRFGTESGWIKIGASYSVLLILILGEAILLLSMLS